MLHELSSLINELPVSVSKLLGFFFGTDGIDTVCTLEHMKEMLAKRLIEAKKQSQNSTTLPLTTTSSSPMVEALGWPSCYGLSMGKL